MRRFTGTTVAFLRRLLSGPEPAPPVGPVLPGSRAVAGIEALSCEGIAFAALTPSSAVAATRQHSRPPLNAFGKPVIERECSGASGTIAAATGMALAGLRATAFVSFDDLAASWGPLRTASRRLVPLVLHAVGEGGHDGLHVVADTGPFQVMPSTAQEAVDLTLLARWLTERALIPGVVAMDAELIENAEVPDLEAIQQWLGWPDEMIGSPTEAQRLLFGEERPRMATWFDPDHPVATGTSRGADRDRAANAGRAIFFGEHVRDLASKGLKELGEITGRPQSFVHTHRLDDAKVVIVARGATVQVAAAVTDYLRVSGEKVGVLGVTWLRPFPTDEVARALDGRADVVVIDVADGVTEPPLMREVRAAVSAPSTKWISALSAGIPEPAEIARLVRLLAQRDRPSTVRLGLVSHEDSGFPRRDALVRKVVDSYPAASGAAVGALPLDATAGVIGLTEELGPDAAARVGDLLAQHGGPTVRGVVSRPEHGVTLATVSGGTACLGPAAPVELLVVASGAFHRLGRPLVRLVSEGRVLIPTDAEPAEVWARFPEHWRDAVKKARLSIELVRGCKWDVALDHALGGEVEGVQTVSLNWSAEQAAADLPLPELVRRVGEVRTAVDSLPRFWGEVVQPDRAIAAGSSVDPVAVVGAIPACSSALDTPSAKTVTVPKLDAASCTGCGKCWQACPDSAIAVTAIDLEALLNSASLQAGTSGKSADALRRSHKHIAARLGKKLEAGALESDAVFDAWGWLSAKMDISDNERPEYGAALNETVDALRVLDPVISEAFFTGRDKANREALVLAVDPRSCQDCGLCSAVCEPGALVPAPRDEATLLRAYEAWEKLPDTAGTSIVAAESDVDLPAATLLSRHCAQALVGGGAGAPGSGARLGTRLVVAQVERHAQEQLASLAGTLSDHRDALWSWVRGELAGSLEDTDLPTFADAVGGGGRNALANVAAKLEKQGVAVRIDRAKLERATRVAVAAETFRARIVSGADGLGRARFGVVSTQGAAGDWASRFPHHPFHAPLTIAPTESGVELALGIAGGLLAAHIELVRTLRRSALLTRRPSDLPGQLETVDLLTWSDLTVDEKAGCTPLLLMVEAEDIAGGGFGVLTRLLTSDLPIKILLLDGRGDLDAVAEPSLVALAHRSAYVAAVSVGHPDHLGKAVRDALKWPGPAFLHLHAPSPAVHGFDTAGTLEQAQRAVACRGHVLLTWDPSREGTFGTRLSLDGNPEPDADLGGNSFEDWAATEARFLDPSLPITGAGEQRVAIWNTLRELAGIAGPFAERAREQAESSLTGEHEVALTALRAEQTAAVAAAHTAHQAEALGKLTDRLMELAGYAADNGVSR